MEDRARWQTVAWGIAAVVVVFLAARQIREHRDSAAPVPTPVAVERPDAGHTRGRAGVVVHVAGAVRRPGVFRVPAGARVDTVVRRAGGLSGRADATAVNLAAKVRDGQQVVVPARGAPGAAAGADATAPGAGRTISLGTATAEQLDGLDGIGPGLAKRILEYRAAHGGFRSVEELQEVGGIGPKRFEALKDAVAP